MALVIYILLYADQNNYNTCLCQKEIVENWDVSEEELWEVAMRNTMMMHCRGYITDQMIL